MTVISKRKKKNKQEEAEVERCWLGWTRNDGEGAADRCKKKDSHSSSGASNGRVSSDGATVRPPIRALAVGSADQVATESTPSR